MSDMESQGIENALALAALAFSLLSFAFTFYLDRKTRGREEGTKTRDDRIEKSTAYLQLELASIEVFKYRAAHWDALHWPRPARI